MESQKRIHPAVAALIVIVLIGLATAALIVVDKSKSTPSSSLITTPPAKSKSASVSTAQPSQSASPVSYKDGSYSATGTYITPGGQESIGLQITLVNGQITDTNLTQEAISGDAKEYQADFASEYKDLIVGKKIDDVSLTRVAGASLTPNGFNDALKQIKSEATS